MAKKWPEMVLKRSQVSNFHFRSEFIIDTFLFNWSQDGNTRKKKSSSEIHFINLWIISWASGFCKWKIHVEVMQSFFVHWIYVKTNYSFFSYFYNWTMTFRRDSDIINSYGPFVAKKGSKPASKLSFSYTSNPQGILKST